jgi:hypothetical protein
MPLSLTLIRSLDSSLCLSRPAGAGARSPVRPPAPCLAGAAPPRRRPPPPGRTSRRAARVLCGCRRAELVERLQDRLLDRRKHIVVLLAAGGVARQLHRCVSCLRAKVGAGSFTLLPLAPLLAPCGSGNALEPRGPPLSRVHYRRTPWRVALLRWRCLLPAPGR